MDLDKALSYLWQEKQRIERAIISLEQLQSLDRLSRQGRGRKSMGAEERARVSRRMRAYWAARRQQKGQN